MPATVSIPTVLRPHAGGARRLEAGGATVGEVFDEIARLHPRLGQQLLSAGGGLPVFVNVFVDDEDIRYLEGLATPVDDRTEITILPAVAGG
jgi:molybdopterin converting factor small subunit